MSSNLRSKGGREEKKKVLFPDAASRQEEEKGDPKPTMLEDWRGQKNSSFNILKKRKEKSSNHPCS